MAFSSASRQIRDTIREWCDANGVSVSFHHRKRGHPYAFVAVGKEGRKVTFSGSPSDSRAHLNALQSVKAVHRALSRKQKKLSQPEKETEMHMASTRVNGWDRAASSGAASPGRVVVPTIDGVPVPPQSIIDRGCLPRGGEKKTPAEEKYKRLRDEFIESEMSKGVDPEIIAEALSVQGYQVTVNAVMGAKYRMDKAAKERQECMSAATLEPLESSEPVQPKQANPNEVSLSQDFVSDLMAVIRRHTGDLKKKADKWDLVSDLMKDA